MLRQPSLSVGVPYRDEGQNTALLFGGLLDALSQLPPHVEREVVVCVNGSDRGGCDALREWAKDVPPAMGDIRVIASAEGKLVAQKAILRERRLQGYVAFVDSDVVVEGQTLRLLWDLLEREPRCMVAYAQPVPIFPEQPNGVHRLLRVHYSLREVAYKRPYFHGRAFMLREWFYEDPPPLRGVSAAVAERLRLHQGPLVDDIVMSRIAIAKWGLEAIREVPEANVYFDTPDSLTGMYAGALRVALEIQRLDLLYPDHDHLQRTVFEHVWHPGGIARHSPRLRAAHSLYRLLDTAVKKVAKLHVWMVKAGLLKVKTLWIQVPGTKSFPRKRRAWNHFSKGRSAPRGTA